jgi:hypothetical protein
MLKPTVAVLAACLIFVGAPLPALADQADDFLAACNKATDGQSVEMCKCKAKFAVKTLDERMLGYVITAMAGSNASVPADVLKRWDAYLSQSNRTCKPNY